MATSDFDTVESFDPNGNFADAITAIGTAFVTLVIDKRYYIDTNVKVDPNIKLMFVDEGELVVVGDVNKLEIHSPENLSVKTTTPIFGYMEGGTMEFLNGGIVYLGWWGHSFEMLNHIMEILGEPGVGGVVLLPGDEILVESDEMATLYTDVSVQGTGGTILKAAPGVRPQPFFQVPVGESVENVSCKGVIFDNEDASENRNFFELLGETKAFLIESCTFQNARKGIFIAPEEVTNEASGILIQESTFRDVDIPVYVGGGNGDVHDISVSNNMMSHGGEGGEQIGIKCDRNASNLILDGNSIRGFDECAIQLFTSGKKSVVTSNSLSFNKDGIVGRFETADGSHQVIISANLIYDNYGHGVKVTTDPNSGSSGQLTYLFEISDNAIYRNRYHGLWCEGHQISVCGNQVYDNAWDAEETEDFVGILLQGHVGHPSEFVTIADNVVCNNGTNLKTENTGILVGQYVSDCAVTGNTVSNDDKLDGDFQNVGIKVLSDVSALLMKNNRCQGDANYQGVVLDQSAEIIGERVVCELGTMTGLNNVELPVYSALSDTCMLSATLIAGNDVPTSSTYEELTVINKGTNGTGSGYIFNKVSDSGAQIKAFVGVEMPYVSNPSSAKYVAKDEVLSLERVPDTGTPGLKFAKLVLNFVTF